MKIAIIVTVLMPFLNLFAQAQPSGIDLVPNEDVAVRLSEI